MKKVLIVVRVFPPFSPVGHSIRAVKFVKYLPESDWLPTVLTIDDQMEYETMRKVGSGALLSEIQPQVKIYRTGAGEPSLRYLSRESELSRRNRFTNALVKIMGGTRRWAYRNIMLPDRYLTWLPYAVRRGRQIVRSEGIDVIFATCPPHSTVLVGAVLKGLTGKPLVLDYRDDWIDTPWYKSSPRVRRMFERKMEGWAVRMADKVVLVTDWSRNAFLDRYSAEPTDKFALIPNGVDLREIAATDSRTTEHRNSKFTIVHAGSLNESKKWGRSADGLFQAIRRILRKKPDAAKNIRLVFAGDLPEGHRMLAEEMGLSDLIQGTGHVPHSEVLSLISSADLLLAINYEGWSTIIPGKIYEYWAVGGPPILLLSCPGAAATFVEQHHLGFAVEPSDVSGIEHAILSTYHQSRGTNRPRVSRAGIEAYDRRALTCQLADVLSSVCGEQAHIV